MHERRVVGERGLEVVDDRQRLDLELDRVDRGLGLLGRERGDRGDDLALVAHDVAREQRAVLDVRAVAHVGHVGLGDHREHARHRARAASCRGAVIRPWATPA